MRVSQYPKPQYQDVGGRVAADPIRAFRGLNGFDPLSVESSYFTDMLNMDSSDFPAVSTRLGARTIGSFSNTVRAMSIFNNELHAVFNDGVWRKTALSGAPNWQTVKTGFNSLTIQNFASFVGNHDRPYLFAVDGGVLVEYNGTSVSNVTGAPSGGLFLTVYQNRLWMVVGSELKATSVDNQTDWDTYNGGAGDSYGRQLEFPNGESATGMFVTPVSLIITSKNSILELTGSDPTNFQLRLLTSEAGASSAQSSTNKSGVTYFTGSHGIYQYSGGSLPDRTFSEIIQNFLRGNDFLGAAGTDGDLLFFTNPGRPVLVYDPRVGVQAWGQWESGLAPRFFASYFSPTLSKIAAIMGTESGKVLVFDRTDQDDSGPISWSVTTIPFTNPSITSKQRWYKIFINLEYTGTIQIHLSKSVAGNDWEQVVTENNPGPSKTKRFIVAVNKYALEDFIRIKISGQGMAKIHEINRVYRQLPIY